MAIVINGTGTITGISATDGLSSPQTGSVLQVVNTLLTTNVTTTSTSFVDSGLSLAITPKFTTSKILVLVEVNGLYVTGGSLVSINTRIVRNSTTLSVIDTVAGYHSYSGDGGVGGASLSYLDSPATTSSTTYKLQYATTSGSNGVYINGSNPISGGNGSVSSITLMEIAG
jgi:hypothetical protein